MDSWEGAKLRLRQIICRAFSVPRPRYFVVPRPAQTRPPRPSFSSLLCSTVPVGNALPHRVGRAALLLLVLSALPPVFRRACRLFPDAVCPAHSPSVVPRPFAVAQSLPPPDPR